MRVARAKHWKRDANKTLRMMNRAGMKRAVIVGARGFWTVVAQATARQLAAFASEEAKAEQGK